MADPVPAQSKAIDETLGGVQSRKEKRKALKKLKRKQIRKEAAIKEREKEEAISNDPEEQLRIRLKEQEEAEIVERARKEFEERERIWLETAAKSKAEEEERKQREILEESEKRKNQQAEGANQEEEDGEWEYVEDGPAEIIWQGNEIIVKKKRIKVSKKSAERKIDEEDADRPTSNPLPPQSLAFASYNSSKRIDAQELLEDVPQQVPNFGTEQDKAHCPFHLKTGACRFGTRCSRAHFYPDKSSTLLIKNMYNGPGLAWEQDEGLEYTDEEIERSFEEFYEDVHTEFLKFGELINFKVCKNGSYHLRGNVYVHYKSMESAILAYNTMNGRYFAGKPISCEFVGVTRWKVAICGEYMKSRLRTCSRGTACNFIHCFRNPGGDYEWADWDNPPPKFWIRKMAVLFGHSDEYGYDKQTEEENIERSRDSSKKRTSLHSRHHSSRSQDDTMDVRDSGSGIEKSDRKWDRHSRRSVEREYSRRRRKSPDNTMEVNDSGSERKESRKRRDGRNSHSVRVYSSRTSEKSERSERNHRSDSHNYNTKYRPLAHESSDERSKESEFIKGHCRYEKKPRTNEELSSSPKGTMFSDETDKSERKPNKRYRGEDRLSGQLGNDTDDNGGQSESRFSVEYIDAQDRYDDRYCTNQTDEETGKYESKYRSTHRRYKTEHKGKSAKQEVNDDRNSSEEPHDRWESTNRNSDLDESLANESDNSPRKESKSRGKINYHGGKRKHKVHTLCSDEKSDRSAHKKYSRSQTPAWSSASSEEKRFQQSGHNS